ncbi:MAG TPA: phosphate ABC transporter substrate-binding protein PstS [Burkholderiales bacterium]|nr:phosphate ABC transporter substrate-binding protein PstS [Burkholderiales bacterium]
MNVHHVVRLGIAATAALLCSQAAAQQTLTGTGSTFAAKLYERWGADFKSSGGVEIRYTGTGSGAGIKAATQKKVDFGGTDKALSYRELAEAGLKQFPIALGGVAPIVNLHGVGSGQIKLTGDVLAKIYLGEIKRWNDHAIAALNPELKLPALEVVVAHRSDSSGTTSIFNEYLSQASEKWKEKNGAESHMSVPSGRSVEGNKGMVQLVKSTPGAIGYADFSSIRAEGAVAVQLGNSFGHFIVLSEQSIQNAALRSAWDYNDLDTDFKRSLINVASNEAWPIVAPTFMLIQKSVESQDTGKRIYEFVAHSFKSGDEGAKQLGYVPLPPRLKDYVLLVFRTQIVDAKGNSFLRRKAAGLGELLAGREGERDVAVPAL